MPLNYKNQLVSKFLHPIFLIIFSASIRFMTSPLPQFSNNSIKMMARFSLLQHLLIYASIFFTYMKARLLYPVVKKNPLENIQTLLKHFFMDVALLNSAYWIWARTLEKLRTIENQPEENLSILVVDGVVRTAALGAILYSIKTPILLSQKSTQPFHAPSEKNTQLLKDPSQSSILKRRRGL